MNLPAYKKAGMTFDCVLIIKHFWTSYDASLFLSSIYDMVYMMSQWVCACIELSFQQGLSSCEEYKNKTQKQSEE